MPTLNANSESSSFRDKFARADSPFVPALDHAATETILAENGGMFTSLRHGFYAESALHMIGSGLAADEIRAPEDGPVSWTARADLAEADAVLLANEGRLDGVTPPLTAPEAFTMAELAAIAAELTGREITRVTLSDDTWVEEKVAAGVPRYMAEMLLGTFRAARRLRGGRSDIGDAARPTAADLRDVLAATLARP
jgi:NAD(P)H dehydrogenase (quinone)